MIVGLGTDIVSIERIAKLLSRNETTFIEKICSANEKTLPFRSFIQVYYTKCT